MTRQICRLYRHSTLRKGEYIPTLRYVTVQREEKNVIAKKPNRSNLCQASRVTSCMVMSYVHGVSTHDETQGKKAIDQTDFPTNSYDSIL